MVIIWIRYHWEGVMIVMSLIIFRQSKITNSLASFEPMTSHQHRVGWCSIYRATEEVHGEQCHWASYVTRFLCSIKTALSNASCATFKKSFFVVNRMLRCVEACVAEWLRPQTPDLEVRGSSLARRVVSLDKELYSTLSLFTQVYKWVPATYCWGVTLRWTSIPSRG